MYSINQTVLNVNRDTLLNTGVSQFSLGHTLASVLKPETRYSAENLENQF